MKKYLTPIVAFLLIVLHISLIESQVFTTNTSLPFDLDAGTSYSSCGSPGTNALSFTVSSVGLLNTTTKQLAEINIRLDAACGGNISKVKCYIKSPSGTCAQIANTMGTSTDYSVMPNAKLDYTFRNIVSACLNKAPNYVSTNSLIVSEKTLDGQYGVFSTYVDIATAFNGENANGTWIIYFYDNTAAAPCVLGASIYFGDPTIIDKTSMGDDCTGAIVWDGSPICASTNGMTPSSNMPCYNGSSFTNCLWNGSNDNDTWIKFQATKTNVSIAISGLSNTLQSIIVTDPNIDGDNNACTGAGSGTYWTVINCPRDSIYPTTSSGTSRNHNNCFTANIGQTYYLVIDGSGGAISPFYITGISGTQVVLPLKLLDFSASCIENGTVIKWQTATQEDIDYFTIERSENGTNWEKVTRIYPSGSNNQKQDYSYVDDKILFKDIYYRLKQTDLDGEVSYSKIVNVNCKDFSNNNIKVIPNPTTGLFHLTGLIEGDVIEVFKSVGEKVNQTIATESIVSFDMTEFPVGLYYITVTNENTVNKTKMIIR